MSHINLSCTPYCYLIGWSALKIFYYGVRFSKDADPSELWVRYFSSSEIVKRFRTLHGEPDIVQIRKKFEANVYGSVEASQKAAIRFETGVIRRMKMINSNTWLNCCANIESRTGEQIVNHTKYRRLKFGGQYHSENGTERMRRTNRENSKKNNPMHRPDIKAKHLDSIAIKLGYSSHQHYLNSVSSAFIEHGTIKGASMATGHSQYAIRHLLLEYFGTEWVENIRVDGIAKAKDKQKTNRQFLPKKDTTGSKNPNAYVWRATSPDGDSFLIYGNRLEFCKERGIGTSLDPTKPHLRQNWTFTKICRLKLFDTSKSSWS